MSALPLDDEVGPMRVRRPLDGDEDGRVRRLMRHDRETLRQELNEGHVVVIG
jgi:hypothetical protein